MAAGSRQEASPCRTGRSVLGGAGLGSFLPLQYSGDLAHPRQCPHTHTLTWLNPVSPSPWVGTDLWRRPSPSARQEGCESEGRAGSIPTSITEGPVFVVTPSGFLLFVACDTPRLSLEDSMAGSQGAVGLRWSCQPSSVLWVLRVPEDAEDAGLCLLLWWEQKSLPV